MRFKVIKPKYFLKYLISYVIAFYLPVSILSIIFYSFFIDAYRSEVLNSNSGSILRYKTEMDLKLTQIEKMATQILAEEEFYTLFVQDEYKRIKTVERLYSYNVSNEFISEIMIYYRDLDLLVTSSGASELKFLNKDLLEYKQWPMESLIRELKYSNKRYWRRTEPVSINGSNRKNMLTYVCPLNRGNRTPFAVALFQVEESALLPISNNEFLNLNSTDLIIVDSAENIIYPTEDKVILESSQIHGIIDNHAEKGLNRFESKKNIVTYIKSDINDWTYVWISLSKQLLTKIERLQWLLLFLVGFITLLGSVVIFILMQLNYNPLKKLMSYVKSSVVGIPEDIGAVEAARYAIGKLQEANVNMHEVLSKSAPSIKKEALSKLIEGYFDNFESFNSFASKCGITIESKFLCVAAIKVRGMNKKKNLDYDSMISELEHLGSDNVRILGIDSAGKNEIVIILFFDIFVENIIKELLLKIQHYLSDKLDLSSFVGVGSLCSKASEVNRSYVEASLVVKGKMPEESGIDFYKSVLKNMVVAYPSNEMEMLKEALYDYDMKAFSNISRILLQTISNGKTSFFLSICLCYDIINTIIKVMKEVEPDFFKYFKYESIARELSSNNLEELMDIISKIVEEVKEYLMKRKNDSVEKNLVEEIKAYIKKNYSSTDFTMQNLADNFGMSLSNISHYFKNQTAITLMDYLYTLKVAEAKDLLLKSSYSIEEIAQKLGYTSTTSLIRLFKQQMGVTPGEYRKVNRLKLK